ncbi:hypothetical protein V8E36_001544 [Tilletia maclaganii]
MSGAQSGSASGQHKSSLSTSSTDSAFSSLGGSTRRVALLDEDGDLTPKFHRALAYIFQKYASSGKGSSSSTSTDQPFLARTFAEEKARHQNCNLREDAEAESRAEREDEEEAQSRTLNRAEEEARAREEEESRRNAMRASFGSTDRAAESLQSSSASSAGEGDGRPSTPTQASSSSSWTLTAPTPIRPTASILASSSGTSAPVPGSEPPAGAVLSDAALDRFAFETNGAPFGAESKAEILEFLDVDELGRLTFEGFLSMYSLQTENDEDETWRDLATHGFDANLELVSTRREESGVDEGRPVPKSRLLGTGMGGPRDETRPETPVAADSQSSA